MGDGLRRKTPLARGVKRLKRTKRLKAVNPDRQQKKRAKYNAFIRSKAWKEQRARVLERDGHRCTRCTASGEGVTLHCHHQRYGSPLERTPDDWIVTLCARCHEAIEADLRPWNRGRFRYR